MYFSYKEKYTKRSIVTFTEMNESKDLSGNATAVTPTTDGAVGISEVKWFIAVMRRPRSEKAAAEALAKHGYEVYVAMQKQLRVWSRGRRRFVDHVVITGIIFINCTEEKRRQAAHSPYISHYMVDCADSRRIATVPDNQIRTLKFMLGQSDVPVEFSPEVYHAGDRVRVVRGNLLGLEGIVTEAADGRSELVVTVDLLGSAKLKISSADIERI